MKATPMINGASWLFWLLEFVGFVLLLAGVSSMQKSCGGSDANFLLSGGSADYLAPVSCSNFFEYTWWIVFYNLFVWVLTAIVLAGFMHRFRPGILALMAITVMQNLITANTYLYYDGLPYSSSAFGARYRTTVAGSILKSIAGLVLIGLMGYRDEYSSFVEPEPKPTKIKHHHAVAAPVPAGPTTVTHQSTVCPPGYVPASTVSGGGVRGAIPVSTTTSRVPPV